MQTSKRLQNFPEYIFSILNKKIAEVEMKTGRKVLNLGIGSPDFPPSKKYIEKFKEFIDKPKSQMYPGYAPIQEFTNTFKEWFKRRYNVILKPDEMYNVNGAKDAITALNLALLDKGDEVLIPNPGYQGYPGPALMLDAVTSYYELNEEDNFSFNLQKLTQKISSKTKFIWLNFPSNPTGTCITLEELEPIVDIAKKKGIILVYDNAYSEITFDGFTAPSILQVRDAKNVAVEIGSFSKSLSFAGLRIGYIAGNYKIIQAVAKIKSILDSGTYKPIQQITAYALEYSDSYWSKSMIVNYKNRRNILAKYLKLLELDFTLPKGGLYIWAKIPEKYKNSEDFAFNLLESKQVLMTPGTAFGSLGKKYVRVSICSDIDRIDEYFD